MGSIGEAGTGWRVRGKRKKCEKTSMWNIGTARGFIGSYSIEGPGKESKKRNKNHSDDGEKPSPVSP